MPVLAPLFLLALTVKTDHTPLRASCGDDGAVVAILAADTPIEVKFAVEGGAQPCYKVQITAGGKTVAGYLPKPAVTHTEEFDRARRNAAWLEVEERTGSAEKTQSAGVGIGFGSSAVLREARQLLAENQPNKALEELEREIKTHGDNAGVLAAAGVAAWRSDNSHLALAYWKQSLALQPNPELARLCNRVEKEVSGDRSNERLYGIHFALRYEGETVPSEVARRMVEAMDREFVRISEQIGCPASERIVAIVQSRQAYLKSTDAAEWSGAQYDGRIRFSLVEGERIGDQTRRIFAHEIVHACLATLGRWPAWLHEGLAQKLSGETLSSAAARQLETLKKAHALPRLENLSQDWSRMDAEHARIAYRLALQAVDLLYQRYGNAAIRNIVNRPESLPRLTAELNRDLGL